MFSPGETAQILEDAKRIGNTIGWSDRGVSLPTQDVLVQNLSKESQDMVHRAIREQLLPYARWQYPHLNAAFDKQPYPRPGNLFIVRYSAANSRPGGRGLKMHKDETALTFNLCLSPQDGFEGGGTYFPAASGDVDGILLRPTPGFCLVHDGNIRHAGNDVTSGDRYILVGFYNADGRDRAGEECYFNKKALEVARQQLISTPPPPTQTIYFTTAVAAGRGSPILPVTSTQDSMLLPPESPRVEDRRGGGGGGDSSQNALPRAPRDDLVEQLPPVGSGSRNLSSVAIQGPIQPIPGPVLPGTAGNSVGRGTDSSSGAAGSGNGCVAAAASAAAASAAAASAAAVAWDMRSEPASLDGMSGLSTPGLSAALPPRRPGSPARPATPTDSVSAYSVSGLLTPPSLSPGRGSPTERGNSSDGDGWERLISGGGASSFDERRRRDGSGSFTADRGRDAAKQLDSPGQGALHNALGGGGGPQGCSTSCIPNWPVLNALLVHAKMRPAAGKTGK